MDDSVGIPFWAVILLCITIFIIAFFAGTSFRLTEIIPQCAEDVVIVGGGQYSNGRWDYYSCGPARDDL